MSDESVTHHVDGGFYVTTEYDRERGVVRYTVKLDEKREREIRAHIVRLLAGTVMEANTENRS